ncbi:MAG: sterol desaturase family protein [Caulobacteraceae bacterium]
MPWGYIELAVAFLAFGALAKLCPCNRGQNAFVSPELVDNVLYWGLGAFFLGGAADLYLRAGVGLALPHGAAAALAALYAGYGPASRLPLLVQAMLLLLAMDFAQYWLHRLFHGRALWPFHAIHHSAETLDWTTTYRIHPVNFLVYTAGAVALVRLVGFSAAAYAIVAPFNVVMSPLVHANLNWTFGPFRYVLASPVFHRWHHVKDPKVHNRNFAPTFPVLDLVFGTFYMPKGVLPADYGAEGTPPHFLAQLAHPFVVTAARLGLKPKARTAATA